MSAAEWQGNEETYSDDQEKKVLLGALSSFYQYSKIAHFNTTHLRRQSFYALPRAHWELLAKPPFSYLDTLDAVDSAIDKNSEIATAILQSGLESFGLSNPILHLSNSGNDWRTSATTNDLEKARSTIRQLFRDWSEEGLVERKASHLPVFDALQKERTLRNGAKMNVLVPGAGLGRLVFDLCLDGFDAEGNEISYHQLLASSYILNHCVGARVHTLFPWVHSFSNHKSRENHLKSVQIPDVSTRDVMSNTEGAGQMSMSASDFLLLYGSEEQRDRFDAVVTVFFLDTAPNLIRYLEVVRNCLRTGGLLINVGPLLWHFEGNAPGSHGRVKEEKEVGVESWGIADPGSVELTDDEVVALVEQLGFTIENRESGIAAPYIQDTASMLQNTYQKEIGIPILEEPTWGFDILESHTRNYKYNLTIKSPGDNQSLHNHSPLPLPNFQRIMKLLIRPPGWGFKVYITSRKASACHDAVKTLNALPNLAPGAKAIAVSADISTVEGVEGLVKQVKETTDVIDVLFANAGASWGEGFDTHPDKAFGKVMDLNVKSVFGCIRLFTPLLEKRGTIADPSRVIITASVAGLAVGTLGPTGAYGYSASKAAAIHLAKNLAVELGPRHILVNAIAPGFFPSKMANGPLDLAGGAEHVASQNLSKRSGIPEDIAGLAVFLCSKAGAHINGAVITVDGGEHLKTGAMMAVGEKAKI